VSLPSLLEHTACAAVSSCFFLWAVTAGSTPPWLLL
jgi:hypothetical protein